MLNVIGFSNSAIDLFLMKKNNIKKSQILSVQEDHFEQNFLLQQRIENEFIHIITTN